MADFVKLATLTPSSGATAVFTNIDQTYTDLAVYIFGRGARSDYEDWLIVRPNSDSGANYSYHGYSTAYSSNTFGNYTGYNTATSYNYIAALNANGAGNYSGAVQFYITNYSSTTKTKNIVAEGGGEYNGIFGDGGGWWNSTTAITSLYISMNNSTGWASDSTLWLYGIKN